MLKFTKAAKINVFTSFWMNFQKMVKYLFSIIFYGGGGGLWGGKMQTHCRMSLHTSFNVLQTNNKYSIEQDIALSPHPKINK